MTATTPTQRIFVALPLPLTLKRELELYQGALLKNPRQLKIVKPELFHVTLHFFGNLTADQLALVQASLPPLFEGLEPFPIEIGGVAAFPNAIVIPVVTNRDIVIALGMQVRGIAQTLGLPVETRAINPHITLARLRERGADPTQFMNEEEAEEAYRWTAQSVVVYESKLSPGGPAYIELSRHRFGPSNDAA